MAGVVVEGIRRVDAAHHHVVAAVLGVAAGPGAFAPGQHVEEGTDVLAAGITGTDSGHGFPPDMKKPAQGGLF